MDLTLVQALIDLVASSPVSELEVDDGTMKVRLRRRPDAGPSRIASGIAAAPGREQPVAFPAPGTAAAATHRLVSPMHGTFHRAASPGEAALASVGETVEAGQTVCIIEAMKTMVQVRSERPGTVTEVLVEDGAPVEEGQALLLVEPPPGNGAQP